MHEDNSQTTTLTQPDTFTVPVTKELRGLSVQECLANASGLPQTEIERAMHAGAVWRKKGSRSTRLRNATRLNVGDILELHYAPGLLDQEPPTLARVHIDKEFSVWVKPRDMTISGSRYCDHTSLKRCIETQHPDKPPVFVVHRLDRFTAGLILVAHNKSSAANFSQMFRDRHITKRYHAQVSGAVLEPQEISSDIDGKNALSFVEPIERGTNRSIVEVNISTGRKHQIRRHLASINYPVIGDRLYGVADSLDLQLVATHLGFTYLDKFYQFELNWQDYLTWASHPQT